MQSYWLEEHIHMLNKSHENLWAGSVMHKLIYYLLEQWLDSIRRYLKFKHIFLHLEKNVIQWNH
jgi:hypothetical protein